MEMWARLGMAVLLCAAFLGASELSGSNVCTEEFRSAHCSSLVTLVCSIGYGYRKPVNTTVAYEKSYQYRTTGQPTIAGA